MAEILVYSGSHLPEGEFQNLLNDLDRIDPDNLVTGIKPQQKGYGATWGRVCIYLDIKHSRSYPHY